VKRIPCAGRGRPRLQFCPEEPVKLGSTQKRKNRRKVVVEMPNVNFEKKPISDGKKPGIFFGWLRLQPGAILLGREPFRARFRGGRGSRGISRGGPSRRISARPREKNLAGTGAISTRSGWGAREKKAASGPTKTAPFCRFGVRGRGGLSRAGPPKTTTHSGATGARPGGGPAVVLGGRNRGRATKKNFGPG